MLDYNFEYWFDFCCEYCDLVDCYVVVVEEFGCISYGELFLEVVG